MTSSGTIVNIYIKIENASFGGNVQCSLTDTNTRTTVTTEVLPAASTLEFQTALPITYVFEARQDMALAVNGGSAKHRCSFTMGELMAARRSMLERTMGDGCTVFITAAAVGAACGTFAFALAARDLPRSRLLSKPCVYFTVARQLQSGQAAVVFSSAEQKSKTPQWPPTPELDIKDLCGGDMASKCIRIELFDRDGSSSSSLGSALLSGEALMAAAGREFQLSRVSKGKTKTEGVVSFSNVRHVKGYSFTDYLQAGMEVNVAFSIDFTGSNGPQSDPRSLHFYDPVRPNHYIRAMLAVSDVVQEYDSDRQFPAYGFGAVAPFTQGTSHFFPLNGNPANAYLNGMQQVVDTYAGLLPQLRFSGPTNFAPTISAVTQGAREANGVYTILMIMTDGAITDMQDTIDCIVDADDAPLSIVIIGVGNADFSSMVRLDGDDEPLVNRRGRATRRDLVQFVPFNAFERKPPALLAAAVLEEIPKQVEVWSRLSGCTPESYSQR